MTTRRARARRSPRRPWRSGRRRCAPVWLRAPRRRRRRRTEHDGGGRQQQADLAGEQARRGHQVVGDHDDGLTEGCTESRRNASTSCPEWLSRLPVGSVGDDHLRAGQQRPGARDPLLASRARRRVRGQAPAPDPDLARQRDVVDAFFAASRDGDFDALVAVLHPDVVLRSDGGLARPRLTMVLRGAQAVAGRAFTARRLSPFVRPALVTGPPEWSSLRGAGRCSSWPSP
jgi:hypothetical protein